MKPIRWPRVLRLFVFAVLVAFLALDLGMSWTYVYRLTHPGCPPAPALAADLPTPTNIELTTQDGLLLEAWYYPSQNGAAVVAMGGPPGSLGGHLPYIEPLLRAGYGVLQIEGRGCATPAAAVTLGYEEAFDAVAGMQYILHYHSDNVKHIGIMGFSMGAAAAIRAAARNPEFSAMLAEGGYFNLGDDFVEADSTTSIPVFQRVVYYSVAGVFWLQTGINPWESSPVDDIARISPRPVLLVYGEYEVAAGRALAQYEAAGQPKSLWIVPGGDHGSNQFVAPEEYAARILAFFDHALLGK